jgi:hypothetical protein
MKIPICTKCGSMNIEKVLVYKTFQTMKWDCRNKLWVLKDTKIESSSKMARHFCNNCDYYQKIAWKGKDE